MRYLRLILLPVFIFFVVPLSAQNRESDAKNDSKAALQKLSTVYYLIDNFYVDTADVESITEDVIVTMLKDLDPHSAYISKKDVQRANEPLEGSFEGIGINEFN